MLVLPGKNETFHGSVTELMVANGWTRDFAGTFAPSQSTFVAGEIDQF